ncbi:MAG: ABC transporter substrate-binding protein [Alphaproteobacteria bacterium]|nr:ABC transporter substrate-binding protein [Alphaproteobacteria bacterium]
MTARHISALLLACTMLVPASARADIVIGAYGPITGPNGSLGELMLPGLKLAVEDINAKGGVNGEKLVLQIEDDQCEPKQAVSAANKLVSGEAVAAIGFTCSGATKAASDVFEQEGMPHLASLASNPDLTKQGLKTLFRPAIRDDNDAGAAAEYTAAHFKDKKIGLVHDNTVWAKGQADLFFDDLKAKGITNQTMYELNAKDQDFSALISRMKQDGVELLYVSLYMREGGLLVRQMADQGYKPILVGTVLFNMPDFIAIVRSTANGAYMTAPRLDPARIGDLPKRLNLKDNALNMYVYQNYAAIQILAQVFAKHGTNPGAIIAALHEGTFKTVIGDIKFDAKGDMNDPAFDITVYQDGKGVLVDTKTSPSQE